MPNYMKGKIYQIWSPNTDKVYIGSTTQSLHKRFADHKRKQRSSREVIDCGGAKIELIEYYPCSRKDELNRREGEIQRGRPCVNRCIAGRTPREYRQDNRESIAARAKAYREENRESIAARAKAYREENREAIAAHVKAYREENREAIAAQRKAHREENREAHAARRKLSLSL